MGLPKEKNRRIEKAHWLPSSSIAALVALLLCSIYGTLSPIVMMNVWQSQQAIHSDIDLPRSPHAGNSKNHRNSKAFVNSTVEHSFRGNNELFSRHVVVQSIREHQAGLSMNATASADKDENVLQTERLHVLEVLMNYFSEPSHPVHSDIVELGHCRLDQIDYSNFSRWAAVILQHARPNFENTIHKYTAEAAANGLSTNTTVDSVYLEFCLGLLEVFATHGKGKDNEAICDFEKYPWTPKEFNLLTDMSTLNRVAVSPQGLPRLVFVIIAFQDATHLETLIEACNMPQHLIVVHLERSSPASFNQHVLEVANKYRNVVVVQFGSIIYGTDSVSTVNYQIMHWLTEEQGLVYDYYLTLGNAVYPLYGAKELANHFQSTERDIWLGDLRDHINAGGRHWEYLQRKRLVFTSGGTKFSMRTRKWKQNGFDAPIPDYIQTNMHNKTNSGNQAVFSYKVIKKLVNSPEVKELFAIAKYGCCCCLEERTWIAAANIIGYGKEAVEAASMFQVWGGRPKCGDGSMKNALLIPNATICYQSEDVTSGNLFERQRKSINDTSIENAFFRGDKLLEELRLAKKRGFLFARKFKSTDPDSLVLIEMIKSSIHNQ